MRCKDYVQARALSLVESLPVFDGADERLNHPYLLEVIAELVALQRLVWGQGGR